MDCLELATLRDQINAEITYLQAQLLVDEAAVIAAQSELATAEMAVMTTQNEITSKQMQATDITSQMAILNCPGA